MVSRAVGALLAGGCLWVGPGELEDRLDLDADQVPGTVDCNDTLPSVGALEAIADLACGDSISADVMDGEDTIRVANCVSPYDHEDLLVLGLYEQVYRFSSEVAADVEIELLADDLWLLPPDAEDDAIALVANRGAQCEVDACEIGLPATDARSPDARGEWRPSVQFHAEAAEGWYVVVSGGRRDAGPSPYTLDVRCAE